LGIMPFALGLKNIKREQLGWKKTFKQWDGVMWGQEVKS